MTDVQIATTAAAPLCQASTDERLVDLWLHGRSPHIQRAYRADGDRFLAFVTRPLPTVTLGDGSHTQSR